MLTNFSVFDHYLRLRRPMRVGELHDAGASRDDLALQGRLMHGIVAGGPEPHSRIGLALVLVRGSFATLFSSLYLHGLTRDEPSLAWVCTGHKSWVRKLPERSGICVLRSVHMPGEPDLQVTERGWRVASLARTAVDFVRYRSRLPPRAPDRALGQILDTGRCTMDDIRACADRVRLRGGAFGPASGLHPVP